MATSFGGDNIKQQAPNNQIKRNEKKKKEKKKITNNKNNNHKDQIKRMLMMSPNIFEGENK